jgi:hypothetical protein
MPRKEARIFTSIWQDDDFVALPAEAQRMYFALLSQPELSLCGLLTLAENRWTAQARGMTKARIRADMKLLADAQPRPFILVDYGTDEVLIRSFIRRDHVLRGPKLVRPLVAAVGIVRSVQLRRVIRDELQVAQDDGSMHPAAADAVDQMIKALSQVNTLSIGYPEKHDRAKEVGVVVTGTTDYLGRPEVDLLCNRLADAIEGNGSKRPPVGQAWRDAARLMLDKDGRSVEQVSKAIDWCQNDEFWRGVVLSMPKLRQQYDKLRLAAQRGGGARPATTDARVQAALSLLDPGV